jgi:hypothetical protein
MTTVKYCKFHGPAQLTLDEAKAAHEEASGYKVHYYLQSARVCEIVVYAHLGLWIRYFDNFGRCRWSITWDGRDKELDFFANLDSFNFASENSTDECRYKSTIGHHADGRRHLSFFHMSTCRRMRVSLESAPPVTLLKPRFGDYQDFLSFDYSPFVILTQQWPLEIFPEEEMPISNIALPKLT